MRSIRMQWSKADNKKSVMQEKENAGHTAVMQKEERLVT